jgi:hypothetical protein
MILDRAEQRFEALLDKHGLAGTTGTGSVSCVPLLQAMADADGARPRSTKPLPKSLLR